MHWKRVSNGISLVQCTYNKFRNVRWLEFERTGYSQCVVRSAMYNKFRCISMHTPIIKHVEKVLHFSYLCQSKSHKDVDGQLCNNSSYMSGCRDVCYWYAACGLLDSWLASSQVSYREMWSFISNTLLIVILVERLIGNSTGTVHNNDHHTWHK